MKPTWMGLIGLALLIAMSGRGEEPEVIVPEGNRFLFIVETSSSSSHLEHGGRQPVFDLLFTGLYGQMRKGDSFGVWTFNETVSAGKYPKQIWDPTLDMDLSRQVTLFLKDQAYEKKGHLEVVTKQIAGVTRAIKDINILVFSDPSTPMPNDSLGQGSSKEYAKVADKARKAKLPVMTVVVARGGAIKDVFMTVAGDPIRLPPYAIPDHPPIVKAKPAPEPPPPVARAQPRSTRPPIIITRKTSEADSAADQAHKLGRVLSSSGEISYASSLQTNTTDTQVVGPAQSLTDRVASSAESNSVASAAAVPPSIAVSSNLQTAPTIVSLAPAMVTKESKPAPQEVRVPATVPVVTATVAPETKPHGQALPSAPEPQKVSTQPSALPAAAALVGPSIKAHAREHSDPIEKNSRLTNQTSVAVAGMASGSGESSGSATLMVLIGSALMVAAGMLSVLFFQRLRRPATTSFITRSIEPE